MYIVGVISIVFLSFAFFDWYARRVFIARVYRRRNGHGKSWNRAYKHYKANWTFWQRLFWVPLFKEDYPTKYREIAILSYIHFVFSIVTVACFLIADAFFPNAKFWKYVFVGYYIFLLIRWIYNDARATEK